MGYNPTFDYGPWQTMHNQQGWCAFQKSNIFKNHQNRTVPRRLRVSSDSTENAHQSNGYRHAKLFGGNLQQLCHRLQHGPTVVVVQRHSQMDGGVVQHSAEAWQRDEETTWHGIPVSWKACFILLEASSRAPNNSGFVHMQKDLDIKEKAAIVHP